MSNRPEHLPIVVDLPASDPKLGYEKFVAGIAAAIRGAEQSRFTVGLYGPWGTGKSSLLAALQSELEREIDGDEAIYVAVFDSWRYQHEQDLILPLLACVKGAIEDRIRVESKFPAKQIVQEKAKLFLAKMGRVIRSFEISIPGVVGLKMTNPDNVYEPLSPDLYLAPFQQLKELSKIADEQQRIVILVDDLDRCSPDTIVRIVETMHTLTDVDGFVFVLALDYQYLVEAIRQKYPQSDPHRFIEKLIQVPFPIPPVEISTESIPEVIRTWGELKPWFGNGAEALVAEVVTRALRSNPRQLKRLINLYLLTRYMDWDATSNKEQLLLAILGFQIGWPDEYAELTRLATRRLREESNSESSKLTLASLGNEEDGLYELFDIPLGADSEVIGYFESVLRVNTALEDFVNLVRLTKSLNEFAALPDSEPFSSESSHSTQLPGLSSEMKATYDEVLSYALKLSAHDAFVRMNALDEFPSDVTSTSIGIKTRETKQYLSVYATTGPGTGTPFVTIWLQPRKNTLQIKANSLCSGFVDDLDTRVTEISREQHRFQLTVPAGDIGRVVLAKEFIDAALVAAVSSGKAGSLISGRPAGAADKLKE